MPRAGAGDFTVIVFGRLAGAYVGLGLLGPAPLEQGRRPPGDLGNGRAARIALLALDGGDRRAVRDGLVLGLGRWDASR